MKKKSSGVGARATLMKTKSSGAGGGTMLMKRRVPEPAPEPCHFYDGSTALLLTATLMCKYSALKGTPTVTVMCNYSLVESDHRLRVIRTVTLVVTLQRIHFKRHE